jgi:proteasome lid subunit RPN8/RPN11
MALRLRSEHEAAVRRHAEAGFPHEVCGLLLGHTGEDGVRVVSEVFPLQNERDDSRENRYFVSGLSMLRAERHAASAGLDVVGYYHSHPNAPARPSGYDLEHATWPNVSYPIVSVVDGRVVETLSWQLDDDRSRFAAESIEIVGADGGRSLATTGSHHPRD